MTEQNELDASAFNDLRTHLENYNKNRSYGIVLKPKQSPDLSKFSVSDPKLHHLLMTFGRLHVSIPYTTVDLIWTNKSQKLKYQNNYTENQSWMVGFGSYTKGEIQYKGKEYSIKHRPLVFDDNIKHTINKFDSTRFFLVYYTIKASIEHPIKMTLNSYEAVSLNGKYVMACYRDGLPVEHLTKDHPLVKTTRTKKEKKSVVVRAISNSDMSLVQNLMLWSQEDRALESSAQTMRFDN